MEMNKPQKSLRSCRNGVAFSQSRQETKRVKSESVLRDRSPPAAADALDNGLAPPKLLRAVVARLLGRKP
jgi:hypothetical protein